MHQSLARLGKSQNPSDTSSIVSGTGPSSTPDASRHRLRADDASESKTRNQFHTTSVEDRDMLRRKAAHTSKGLGRSITTVMQTPGDLSMGLTKGFHNMPKLWGDNTVRPQPRVSDFKSGARAAGKEFGLGMYDGFTGLVSQP